MVLWTRNLRFAGVDLLNSGDHLQTIVYGLSSWVKWVVLAVVRVRRGSTPYIVDGKRRELMCDQCLVILHIIDKSIKNLTGTSLSEIVSSVQFHIATS